MFSLRPFHPWPVNAQGYATALPERLGILIETHFQDRPHTTFFCKLLKIPQQKLNAQLKEATGKTLHEHITDRLIYEAISILDAGTLSVKEITYTLGFSDMAQFCKFFKKHTGFRPSEYLLLTIR